MIDHINEGDVFAFDTNTHGKFGIIQVVNKGKIGINIRVFYKTIEDLSNANLKLLIESHNFYYIRDFYEYELINKSRTFIGNFKLPVFIEMPRIMRFSERQNNNLKWFIVDTKSMKITRFKGEIDSDFCHLSPANTWGIDYIKKRWDEHFTLDKWDKFEEMWFQQYLDLYNTKENDDQVKKLIDSKPTNKWFERIRLKDSENVSIRLTIFRINQELDLFLKNIDFTKIDSVNKSVIHLIEKLNIINQDTHYIETEESEMLMNYIDSVLQKSPHYDEIIDYDRLRHW